MDRIPEHAKSKGGVAVIILVIIIVLIVVLLPLSYQRLDYYEYAFKRRKASGIVDTDRVYTGGRHYIGVTYEFKTFQADAHFVELNDLAVFTSDRLEVGLACAFQYFLRIEDLHLLHDTYDLQYEDIMINNAVDALKGTITQFSTREFGSHRNLIESTMFEAVRERLGGACCPLWCDVPGDSCNTSCILRETEACGPNELSLFVSVRYFQLLYIDIPNDVISRNLLTLTQLEDGVREQFVQDAQVVHIQTEKMVQDIQNEASELSQNATAHSNLIRAKAVADAQATVEEAHNGGLSLMYSKLNITTQEQKASLNYLRTLRDHQNVFMSINFNSLVNTAGFGGK